MSSPRLFISYSWSSPEHEQWVIDLAQELASSGVDVVLDKWDLREGHDAIAFMEQMVTDPSIKKVLLICDSVYANKADGRAGGVGTETQIISSEVYAKQAQDKFVAVISEKDATGKPHLPTYYKSRIYIDLSESERYAENFERLLRWVFDRPLFQKPEIGKPPAFITDSVAPILGTSVLAKRAIEGLKNDKGYASGAVEEYFAVYTEQLERFRIPTTGGERDDAIAQSIEDFLPARDELLQVIATITRYSDPSTFIARLHRFLESLIPYLARPASVTQWNEIDFDNFKFIVHELFLYSMALLLRGEHLEAATYLLEQPYYVPGNSEYGKSATVSFTVFDERVKSLEIRNERLKIGRLSLRADLLEKRSHTSGVHFRDLMQADFVCFFREEMKAADDWTRWWPETLVYAGRYHGPLEIFARTASKIQLARVLALLGAPDLAAVKATLDEYGKSRTVPRWQFDSFNPAGLLGYERLAKLG